MIRMFRYMFLLMAWLMSNHAAWSANYGSSDRDSTSIDVWIDGWEEDDDSWNDGDAEGGGSSEVKTFVLRYVVDGKEVVSYTLLEGTEIEAIPEPKKEGYVFSGWSEIPITMPAHDVTVEGSFIVDSGISDVTMSSFVDVYALNGLVIKRNVRIEDLKIHLPQGVYIINGRKYIR